MNEKKPHQDQNWFKDCLLLSLFLLIFYSLWLGSYPLFTPDEGRYSEAAREMLISKDFITPRVNGVTFLDKPILYYWLQVLAISLFGLKEWAIRFFPVLIGILGCLATYLCGRSLFDRRTGLLSALILASAPLYFANAHYANLDLEVAVFISGSLLFFLTASHSHLERRFYFIYGTYLCAALAFLTKGLIGIVFPSLIISMWFMFSRRWSLLKEMKLLSGTLLFLLIILPWYLLVQAANPLFFHYFFITQHFSRFLSTGEFNNHTPFWFYLPVLVMGFFPWTIFFLQAFATSIKKVWQNREKHSIELFLVIWIIVIFSFFSLPKSKIVSYILPIFPALALLVGHYLSLSWETTLKNKQLIFNFIGITFGFSLSLLCFAYYQWLEITKPFLPYLFTIASLFFITSLLVLFNRKKYTIVELFTLSFVSISLSLLILTSGANYLNHNSTKSLVADLQKIARPNEEIISYFKFYQDLPLYLHKKITIVADWQDKNIVNKDNWLRELWYGKLFQNINPQLIDEQEFWRRWQAQKRVFVFLNDNYFNQFKTQAKSYFYLGKSNDIILLSNQPTILALKKID